MRILLSIKPGFANKIFSGEKKYEYRRTMFKDKNVKFVVVYASSPVKKVIGEFEIEGIISDEPNKVWKQTHKESGISKIYFDQYTGNKETVHAIKIGKTTKYKKQLSLSEDFDISFAPQSFVYL
jgi:predicted transcriptional regulator